MAAPMNESAIVPTMSGLRTWKTSDIEENKGASTACGNVSEFSTQVWTFVAPRLAPIYETYKGVSTACNSG